MLRLARFPSYEKIIVEGTLKSQENGISSIMYNFMVYGIQRFGFLSKLNIFNFHLNC